MYYDANYLNEKFQHVCVGQHKA